MLKKLTFALILFPALCLAALAQSESTPKGVAIESATGTKYAILIGVNDYVRLSKLRYAKNDIEALRDELYKIGFEEKNVSTLTCGSTNNKRPSKENIELFIEVVLEQAKERDIVLVAMSGHGIEVDGEARFCPPDTKPDDLSQTTVSIKGIFEAL